MNKKYENDLTNLEDMYHELQMCNRDMKLVKLLKKNIEQQILTIKKDIHDMFNKIHNLENNYRGNLSKLNKATDNKLIEERKKQLDIKNDKIVNLKNLHHELSEKYFKLLEFLGSVEMYANYLSKYLKGDVKIELKEVENYEFVLNNEDRRKYEDYVSNVESKNEEIKKCDRNLEKLNRLQNKISSSYALICSEKSKINSELKSLRSLNMKESSELNILYINKSEYRRELIELQESALENSGMKSLENDIKRLSINLELIDKSIDKLDKEIDEFKNKIDLLEKEITLIEKDESILMEKLEVVNSFVSVLTQILSMDDREKNVNVLRKKYEYKMYLIEKENAEIRDCYRNLTKIKILESTYNNYFKSINKEIKKLKLHDDTNNEIEKLVTAKKETKKYINIIEEYVKYLKYLRTHNFILNEEEVLEGLSIEEYSVIDNIVENKFPDFNIQNVNCWYMKFLESTYDNKEEVLNKLIKHLISIDKKDVLYLIKQTNKVFFSRYSKELRLNGDTKLIDFLHKINKEILSLNEKEEKEPVQRENMYEIVRFMVDDKLGVEFITKLFNDNTLKEDLVNIHSLKNEHIIFYILDKVLENMVISSNKSTDNYSKYRNGLVNIVYNKLNYAQLRNLCQHLIENLANEKHSLISVDDIDENKKLDTLFNDKMKILTSVINDEKLIKGGIKEFINSDLNSRILDEIFAYLKNIANKDNKINELLQTILNDIRNDNTLAKYIQIYNLYIKNPKLMLDIEERKSIEDIITNFISENHKIISRENENAFMIYDFLQNNKLISLTGYNNRPLIFFIQDKIFNTVRNVLNHKEDKIKLIAEYEILQKELASANISEEDMIKIKENVTNFIAINNYKISMIKFDVSTLLNVFGIDNEYEKPESYDYYFMIKDEDRVYDDSVFRFKDAKPKLFNNMAYSIGLVDNNIKLKIHVSDATSLINDMDKIEKDLLNDPLDASILSNADDYLKKMNINMFFYTPVITYDFDIDFSGDILDYNIYKGAVKLDKVINPTLDEIKSSDNLSLLQYFYKDDIAINSFEDLLTNFLKGFISQRVKNFRIPMIYKQQDYDNGKDAYRCFSYLNYHLDKIDDTVASKMSDIIDENRNYAYYSSVNNGHVNTNNNYLIDMCSPVNNYVRLTVQRILVDSLIYKNNKSKEQWQQDINNIINLCNDKLVRERNIKKNIVE